MRTRYPLIWKAPKVCRESNGTWDEAGAVTGVRSPAHPARKQSAAVWPVAMLDLTKKVNPVASYLGRRTESECL